MSTQVRKPEPTPRATGQEPCPLEPPAPDRATVRLGPQRLRQAPGCRALGRPGEEAQAGSLLASVFALHLDNVPSRDASDPRVGRWEPCVATFPSHMPLGQRLSSSLDRPGLLTDLDVVSRDPAERPPESGSHTHSWARRLYVFTSRRTSFSRSGDMNRARS